MKKLLVLLCAAATLLAFPFCSRQYTYAVYELTFSANLISNNYVGNEWKLSYSSDGKNVTDGERWLVSLDNPKTMKIDITVTEKDKIPDIGTGSVTVILNGEAETKTPVTVTENSGYNEGNEAQWEITCQTKLIRMF